MKRNKTFRVFLSLVLTLVMCLGIITTAFAVAGPIEAADEDTPAKAVISKVLKMAEGTTTPATTFTFAFAKKDLDGDNSAAAKTAMPAITSATAAFLATDNGTTTGGVKTVTHDTGSLFESGNLDFHWPHAGVYTYTVTETAGSTTVDGGTMTYSSASYDISVYVANKVDSPGLYIAAIGTTVNKTDDGTASSGKTDPQAGTVTGTYRAMVFTNSYTKTTGGSDVTDPDDQTLAISKVVTGDYGDLTKYFTFSVTITQSGLASGKTYKGYVVEDGDVVTDAANGTISGTDPTNGDYINFPSGSAITVNLKHGQILAFIDNEVGSSYVAVESAYTDYAATASIVVNGTTAIDIGSATAFNTQLSTTERLIGESENSAAFTNTYQTVTPTGISLNNLPFVIMLILAAGALVVYVVAKSRKRADDRSGH